MLKQTAVILVFLSQATNLNHKDDPPTLPQDHAGEKSLQVSPTQNNMNHGPSQQGTGDSPPPWWENPEAYLSILGFPTLGVLIWQAFETRKAAQAASDSAHVAKSGVDALQKLERPWLLIDCAWDEREVRFDVRNWGKTPAEIVYIFKQQTALDMADDLPAIFPFEKGKVEFAHNEWVPQGGPAYNVAVFAHPDQERDLWKKFPADKSGLRYVWFYGCVVYRGTIDPNTIYESRWCYKTSAMQPILGGPQGITSTPRASPVTAWASCLAALST